MTRTTPAPLAPTSSNPPKAPSTVTYGCAPAGERRRVPRCSRYKRAVYGALSGNLQAMLPACTTWEDQLWARMRAVVDVCVEQELRTAKQQDRSLGPLPPG
ncbi:hypothetical protein HPB51_028060 [Rhipicephalus microplus]|uniref:Nuclear pore complex protein n=1 Tax=Rhipicephalus microplus TaxID=6941 RepID=A0A9J6CY06_RHIMP|nr:hypothetical protein HPB51_028060 [Rhipicephalus microplus]